MTRRSRKKTGRKNRRMGRRTFLLGAGAAVCAAAGLALRRGTSPAAADSTPEPSADPNPALPAGEWRAVWVSYLEWAAMDFSTEDAFRAGVVQLLDNCTGLGLNTVLAQVRPFGDALYRSSLFPWSHLCTGVQGQDPGFDPLDVLLQEAHTRGVSVEAWVNPYRLRSSAAMPPNLADGNLANTHPEWVCTVDEGLYLNPAEPAAADYVVQGVAELVQNYAVDGIHFDDYFYPTTDESIDAAQFAASGAGNLAAWRRENVTALVRAVHDTVKAADPTLRFGISPQGNPDNDENQQYSDVTGWLSSASVGLPNTLTRPSDIESRLASIRNALASKDVLVTTYTYLPQVGMTGMTDANGKTTGYVYDDYRRLSLVKNHESKAVMQYKYNLYD